MKMMFAEKNQFKKWVGLSAVLGFVVFILYLFFFTDFANVAFIIEKTNQAIYAFAFLYVIVASTFDALAWLYTLGSLSVETTFERIFSLSWVGHFVDTLIPGGLAGDAFKTYLLTKDKDVNSSKAVASIVIKDVIELLVVLGSLIVGVVLLALNYSVNDVVMTAIGIVMVLLALPIVLIVYLSVNVGALEKLLRLIKWISAKIKRKDVRTVAVSSRLHDQLMDFRDGIISIKEKPKRMVVPIVCQALAWVFELLAFYLVFIAAGSYVGIDKVIITDTIVSNVQGQGIALAGISQIVSSELYRVLGITAGLAIASTLLAGFASFWFKLVLSFGFFQFTVFKRYIPAIAEAGQRKRRTLLEILKSRSKAG